MNKIDFKTKFKIKDVIIVSLLTSAAIILQIIESILIPSPVPGMKLGISNTALMIVMELYGGGWAFLSLTVRILITGVLYGGITSVIYGISGGFLSLCGMLLLKAIFKSKISLISQSVTGAVLHIFGQLCTAALIFGSCGVFSYFTVMLYISAAAGTVTGFAAAAASRLMLKLKFTNITK